MAKKSSKLWGDPHEDEPEVVEAPAKLKEAAASPKEDWSGPTGQVGVITYGFSGDKTQLRFSRSDGTMFADTAPEAMIGALQKYAAAAAQSLDDSAKVVQPVDPPYAAGLTAKANEIRTQAGVIAPRK